MVLDQLRERRGQTLDILAIQVSSRLIQREDAAVGTERLCKSHPNDDRSEYALPGRALALHVDLHVVMVSQSDAVVETAETRGRRLLRIALDLNRLDIGAPVDAPPELPNYLIDARHFLLMEPHHALLNRFIVHLTLLDLLLLQLDLNSIVDQVSLHIFHLVKVLSHSADIAADHLNATLFLGQSFFGLVHLMIEFFETLLGLTVTGQLPSDLNQFLLFQLKTSLVINQILKSLHLLLGLR